MPSDPKAYRCAARSLRSLYSALRTLPTKCLEIHHRPNNTDTDSISPETLQFLAAGKSGIIYAIDDKRVLKEFHESDCGDVEQRAYQRARSHPNIAKLLGTRKDGSMILERGEVLRTICRSPAANHHPIERKLRWLRHAAEGYQHLHDCNIIHADVGCHNMIVTRKGYLKIIDLEGCSIDGEPADSCYEWCSYRPSIPRVSRQTDIFAFGCAIYEVITGRPPHYELEASIDGYRQVEELYANNEFPDVSSLPLGRLIQSCWHGNFNSMSEVVRELEAYERDYSKARTLWARLFKR
ncbi:hypothetical protein PRK78_001844 [Emydomyces testavorans]|uniref:Protein kinase domain-containing protein n=1 Tax=Emydomyces testavorans TaxID=2070801 RepID=A0AAF0DD67_9EURO|nr:hypothetical protein PRK78_001844 [Emydomyces testavorans]